MLEHFISRLRLPIEKYIANRLEAEAVKDQDLKDGWSEFNFLPGDTSNPLGPITDVVLYYSGSLFLFVSVYQDQLDLYLFHNQKQSADALENPQIPADSFSLVNALQHMRSAIPKKISAVTTLPEDQEPNLHSFYLLKGEPLSLYWADLEHGLNQNIVPHKMEQSEYQRILQELLKVVEAGEQEKSLELLNELLPLTKDYDDNFGYRLTSYASKIGTTKKSFVYQIHCDVYNSHNNRFNLLKEALPLYRQYLPEITEEVIGKIGAFIDKHRVAYVERRIQLAQSLIENKEGTLASLKKSMEDRKLNGISTVSCSYLLDIARWYVEYSAFDPAKSLCERIIEDGAFGAFEAKDLLQEILLRDESSQKDRGVYLKELSKINLMKANDTHKKDDLDRALRVLNEYAGFPFEHTIPGEQLGYNFQLNLILYLAEQLRNSNQEVAQLRNNQAVGRPVRPSVPLKIEIPSAVVLNDDPDTFSPNL